MSRLPRIAAVSAGVLCGGLPAAGAVNEVTIANTAAANSAGLAAAVAQGGTVHLGCGIYHFAGTVLLGQGKVVGSGACTVLQHDTASGPFLVFGWGPSPVVVTAGLADLAVSGTGWQAAETCVVFGGAGAPGASLSGVTISGCGVGLLYGDHTWGTSVINADFVQNATALSYPAGIPAAGEGENFTNTKFTECPAQGGGFNPAGVAIAGAPYPLTIVGGTFDDCGLSVAGGHVVVSGAHFEGPGGPVTYAYVTVTGGALELADANVEVTNGSHDLVTCTGGALVVDRVVATFGQASGLYPNNFASAAGTCRLTVSELYPGAIAGFWATWAKSGAARVSFNADPALLNFQHDGP